MSTDLTTHQGNDVAAQMQWAQAVVHRPDGGAQSILPDSYRNNPANVLIAVGLGQSMGLSFAESLYRISVIKGKPSASAELIAANVRRAGHKLRIKVTENPPSATCTIIRADDPDEPTVITRDMEWAKSMGLAGEPNYKKQPATMLSWRAISACARLACPEALYGVVYTPDEVEGDSPAPAPVKAAGLDAIRHAVAPAEPSAREAGGPSRPHQDDDTVEAEVIEETGEAITARTRGRMFALFTDLGITDAEQQRAGMSKVLGRPVESRADLTEADGQAIILSLEGRVA